MGVPATGGAAAHAGAAGAGGGGAQPSTEYVKSMACEGGVMMEVAIAQWWMSLGETTLDVSVEFFGVQPSASPLLLDGRALYLPYISLALALAQALALTLTLTLRLTLTLTLPQP